MLTILIGYAALSYILMPPILAVTGLTAEGLAYSVGYWIYSPITLPYVLLRETILPSLPS